MSSSDSSSGVEGQIGKVLLIGVTGGTGHHAIQGLLEQGITDPRILTRKLDLSRPSLAQLSQAGLELVEADLDDATSLAKAFAGVERVYCHATAGDSAKPDPREVSRARVLAQVAQASGIRHFVYNSAGGADRHSGIGHIEQKYQVEQILQQAGLPTTMLRACLFMEEFWKRYTRPSVLKGSFSFAVQPTKPLHLITTKDMGRVAAYVMKHPEQYIGKAIELAGDVLTPRQMADAFAKAQGKPVVYKEVPPWIFLLLFRKSLFDLIQWYRNHGYQADVPHLRDQEFPGLLTTFQEFLEESHWADETLTIPN
ncbi:NmrA family NAD(P)-binding protein [Leptolyngbya sp. FACHB-671]|uniref:NmrA family NAD(P)-binding protein n=1 Tax=Leptolyngbya sp. FACHB-671 TaxID=2692812 RepID=UPI0016837985|nr:NmrA family NAD(P)-binding protein [Leptolyngbya sp. FACHB-671]MBD2070099.1 NmrA family NAD(P)-binding protein [Leptolyngbya sp. FACHB-671]